MTRVIVWGNTRLEAKEQVLKMIDGLEDIIDYSPSTRIAKDSAIIFFKDGSNIRSVHASESARGYACDISFVPKTISKSLIDTIIRPCTKLGNRQIYFY